MGTDGPKKIMKVEPARDYKKPLYACALAAAIAATSVAVTGCGDLMPQTTQLEGFVNVLGESD